MLKEESNRNLAGLLKSLASALGCGTIAGAREFAAGVPKMSYYHGHNNAVVPVCVCLPGPVEILFDLQPCTALPDHEKRT